MFDFEDLKPPEKGFDDEAHQVARTVLGSICGVGKVFEELFISRVPPPIEKKQQEWRKKLLNGLRLVQKSAEINMDRLANDDEFASVLFHATWIAMKTHQDEKLNYLRNAVINSLCLQNISDDMQLLFIRYIDELMSLHIILLQFLNDNIATLSNITTYEELLEKFIGKIGLSIDQDVFKLLCNDLQSRMLLHISEKVEERRYFQQAAQPQMDRPARSIEDKTIRITAIGKDFLQYISFPNNEEA